MPHALIQHNNDVRAEAESMATNLSASALSTQTGVNNDKDRTPCPVSASPGHVSGNGAVSLHTCVSVHCDQCGDALGDPGFEAHYPTEDAALDAAASDGWRVGPGGRLWCSACGPVLTCEAEGHELTQWCPVLITERHELLTPSDPAAVMAQRQPVSREYRYCRRCCLHESRPAEWLISAGSGSGKSTMATLLLAAGADAVGEVA